MKKQVTSITEIKLPELGEGVTEGELVKWLVSEGDQVKTDQALAEVMTDKASMEVPSPLDGVVKSLFVKEGDTISVGQSFLTVQGLLSESVTEAEPVTESEAESVTEAEPVNKSVNASEAEPANASEAEPANASEAEPANASEAESEPVNKKLATPFVRRMARELGVSLSQIRGSGLAGRVTREDIIKYSGKEVPGHLASRLTGRLDSSVTNDKLFSTQPVAGFSIPKDVRQTRTVLKGVRKKIAEKMQLSKKVIPHFTLLESAEVEQLDKVKNSVKDMLKEREIKVTYLPFVIKCLLKTIKELPELNASIDDFSQEMVIKNYYNFGFAVDTPRGLLVPVIKDVDKKSVAEISFEIQTLADKARGGNILPEDMSGGTITITNIGSLGGEYATPIINAPETAILGMYRTYIKPYWDGSAFVPKKTMNFSLTCDHRLIDGAVSARALKSFIYKIENPLSLFI